VYTVLWFALLGFMMSVYDWTLYGAPRTATSVPRMEAPHGRGRLATQ
jgi:hypothetical protein